MFSLSSPFDDGHTVMDLVFPLLDEHNLTSVPTKVALMGILFTKNSSN